MSKKRTLTTEHRPELVALRSCVQFGASDADHLLLLRAHGTKDFWRVFWCVAGRTLRAHDEAMKPVFEKFRWAAKTSLAQQGEGLPFSTAEFQSAIDEAIRRAKDEYAGKPEVMAFIEWAMPTVVAPSIKHSITERKRLVMNATELAKLYQHREALQKGIRKELAKCVDLGPDLGTEEKFGADVLEVESAAWLKIAADLPAWTNEGEASIDTRLFAFGLAQAHGWRTSRLRERAKRNKIVGLMRHYGLSENEYGGYDEQVA